MTLSWFCVLLVKKCDTCDGFLLFDIPGTCEKEWELFSIGYIGPKLVICHLDARKMGYISPKFGDVVVSFSFSLFVTIFFVRVMSMKLN